jgi:YgiT-type zinc finger domain-containing protein
MDAETMGQRWRALIEDVLTGMQDWRSAHPQATFRELEAAVDERLDRVRARLLEEAALASAAAQVSSAAAACPQCGQPLASRGVHERTVTVQGEQAVHLPRSYGVCPACGAGLFPPG